MASMKLIHSSVGNYIRVFWIRVLESENFRRTYTAHTLQLLYKFTAMPVTNLADADDVPFVRKYEYEWSRCR